jgi:4-hydroxybenzoate polyprenyltransferase
VKLVDLIFFGRPILLIPVWTVYLHYHTIAGGAGYFGISPGPTTLYHLIALTLMVTGTYVFNQLFDIESDRRNEKLFFLPQGIISPRTAWIYYVVLTLAGFAIIVSLFPEMIRVALAIVGLGILYSVPGVRLKDNPFGGLMANAVAYGFLIPWMVSFNFAEPSLALDMVPYFLAIATGYILTTIPDLDGDIATGKRTVAVILGPRGALWLALLTAIATGAISLWVGNIEMAIVAAAALVGNIYLLFSFKFKILLFTCKFPILLLSLLAGVHYLLYPVLLLLTIILTKLYYKRRFGIVYPKLS